MIINAENLPKIPAVYLITNLINYKIYVGSSMDVFYRFNSGYRNEKPNRPISRALRKYGLENFKVELIHWWENPVSVIELEALETAFIDFYNSLNKNKGYNICLFSHNFYGCKHSEATKIRISQKAQLRYDNGFVAPWTGKNHSEESKKKMSEAKIKSTPKGKNHYLFGKEVSKERRANISSGILNSKKRSNPKKKTTYIFKNLITKEIFEGKGFDLYKKFNLNYTCLSAVINGRQKSTKGWVLVQKNTQPFRVEHCFDFQI